jgi:hypothetical protein
VSDWVGLLGMNCVNLSDSKAAGGCFEGDSHFTLSLTLSLEFPLDPLNGDISQTYGRYALA